MYIMCKLDILYTCYILHRTDAAQQGLALLASSLFFIYIILLSYIIYI